MNVRAACVVGFALLLCGCSDADWDHALSYDNGSPSNSAVAQAAPVESAPPSVESASLPPPAAAPQVETAPPAETRTADVVMPAPPPRMIAPVQTRAAEVVAPPPRVIAPRPTSSTVETVTSMTPLPATHYCKTLALNTGANATRDGLDGPAQEQAADALFRQCMSFYGVSTQ
jgi:hypothetical protein